MIKKFFDFIFFMEKVYLKIIDMYQEAKKDIPLSLTWFLGGAVVAQWYLVSFYYFFGY